VIGLRRRWSAAVEGRESGRVVPLVFVRFWRRSTAERWVERMNDRATDGLTRFVVVRRPGPQAER
jgi:hypothetical protein